MGLTKGDKMYFEGAESFYQVIGRSTGKVMFVKDSPSSLKRKMDTTALAPTKTKRHHASQE